MKPKKHTNLLILIIAIISHTALFTQEEFDFEKECNKIDSYIYASDYDGGIDYLKQKISVYDTSGTYPDSNLSFYLQELAKMHYHNNEFDLAEVRMLKSIALDKKLKGDMSDDYISAMGVLVELYREMGLYEKSMIVAKQLELKYKQKDIINDSINYAFFLNNFGILYASVGDLSKGVEYLNKSKIINDNIFGDNHPEKAQLLGNIAAMYQDMGQYAQAEKLYREALRVDEEFYGHSHSQVSKDLNNLANLNMVYGDLIQAEKQLLLAKNIYESNNNRKLGYVYVLVNLAEVYLKKGEFEIAESLCKTGITIAEPLVAKSHNILISLMKELAKIYFAKNEYKKAIITLTASSETLRNTNPEHIELVVQLIYLGHAYDAIHEYDSAEVKYKESLRIAKVHYDKDHKNYISSLNSLAGVLSEKGRKDESAHLFKESMDLFIQNIYLNFDFLSASEKQKYLFVLKDNLNRFNSFAIDYYNEDAYIAGEMFDYNLFMKGLILTSSKKMKEYGLKDTAKVEFRLTYDEWINAKEYLAKVQTLTKSEIEKRQINPDSIEDFANALEKKLTQESAVFAKHEIKKRYSWQDIKLLLSKDEAFVQIVRLPDSDSVIYIALIISGEEGKLPQMVVLNDGQDMENKQYDKYISNIISGCNSNEPYKDTTSYLKYWSKIEQLVAEKGTVYLIPDGVYNKINIAALMMENEKYVYEDHNIVLLTSINDYAKLHDYHTEKNNTAVLFGAPDFLIPGQSDTLLTKGSNVNSNSYFNYGNLRSVKLDSIPMSGIEVCYIDSLLRKFNWGTLLYTDSIATEENIKAVNSPEILHISTHGFFNGQKLEMDNPENRGLAEYEFSSTMNPLFFSGLYLANAQNTLNGNYIPDEFSQDGILTAYEVTNLNLDSTGLVVLSACETGLGDIIPGEGVFGLQRAFNFAGAENIVMSLWEVDARATQLFMRKFYTYWLDGNTKSKAFEKSRDYLRFNTQDYTHPFYWGSFVLLGKEHAQIEKCNGLIITSFALIAVLVIALFIYIGKKS